MLQQQKDAHKQSQGRQFIPEKGPSPPPLFSFTIKYVDLLHIYREEYSKDVNILMKAT